MSDVTGESHTHEYETVTVEPTCENVGFTEERCKTCGVVKADSKKESEAEDAKATGHHYIQYKDETYTKESDADDAKNIVVNAIVCTKCMKAIPRKSSGNSGNMFGSGDDSDELDIPEGLKTGHEYTGKITSLSDDKKKGDVTVSCDSCVGKELDFLDEKDVTLETKKDVEVTSKKEAEDCEKGGKIIYTAKVTVGDNEYEATTTEEAAAEKHVYKPKFTWADDNTCTVTYTCENCKIPETEAEKCEVTSEVTEPTCTEAGKTVYTATATDKNDTKHTDTKEVPIEAIGHTYSADPTYEWSKDYKTCKAIFTCDKKDDTQTVECTVTPATTDATCTEAGKVVYTATCTFKGKEYTCPEKKEVKGDQKDSKAKFAKTSYNLYSTQSGKVSLVSDYKQDGIVSIKSSNPSKVSVNTAGVIKAGVVKGKAVKVTITAVVKSGKTIKTVVTVAPTKITLNATSVPLQLKKSTSVIKVAKATLPGDQIASWSTSNKKVVTVSKSGKITAKKAGKAVITVKCAKKVQKVTVVVKAK